MKPPRHHLERGEKHQSRSSEFGYIGGAVMTGAAVVAAVIGFGVALPVVGVPAAIAALASGTHTIRKRRELLTWEFPQVTLAVDLGNGTMEPLADGGSVLLGDTIVGNYSRTALVSPVPDNTFTAMLVAEEKTQFGHGEKARTSSHEVVRQQVNVTSHVNDGRVDHDFTVTIPTDASSSFAIQRTMVTWYLRLNFATAGPNDSQIFELKVAPYLRRWPRASTTGATEPHQSQPAALPPGESLMVTTHATDVEIGSAVAGHIHWDVSMAPRQVKFSLVMNIEGRGDPIEKVVTDRYIPASSTEGHSPFLLSVPAQIVPTYQGDLFTVTWRLDAQLDVKRRIDPLASAPVRIRPMGWLAAQSSPDQAPPPSTRRNTLPIIDPDAGPPPLADPRDH